MEEKGSFKLLSFLEREWFAWIVNVAVSTRQGCPGGDPSSVMTNEKMNDCKDFGKP